MTNNEILYIATSDGVYAYNSIRFQRIKQPSEAKGNNFFRLQEDVNGDVFCTNLSGQLFRIRNKQMEILYELPSNYVASFNDYLVIEDGIIINGDTTVFIDRSGEVIRYMDKRYWYYAGSQLYSEKQSADLQKYTIQRVNPKTLKEIPGTQFELSKGQRGTAVFANEEQLCTYNLKLGQLNSYSFSKKTLTTDNFVNLDPPALFIDDSTIWIKMHPYGLLQTHVNQRDKSQIFFRDKYTAPQSVSEHGIFLGSDGYGIYQIRNRFVTDITQLNGQNILDIKKASNGIIVAKTSDRRILLIDANYNVKEVFRTENGTPYSVVDDANESVIIIVNGVVYVYSMRDGKLEEFPGNLFGLKRMSAIPNSDSFLYTGTWHMGSFSIQDGKVVRKMLDDGRAYESIYYEGRAFFGTYEDLFSIDLVSEEKDTIRYKGQSIAARRFMIVNGRLLIHSARYGILEYSNGQLHPLKLPFDKVDVIREVFYDEEYLILSDKKNLYLWNLNSGEKLQISRSDGLRSANVKNAFINEGHLYILTHIGLQVVDLEQLPKKELVPRMYFNAFQVNGTSRNKLQELSYNENRISFELAGNAFGKQFDTKYKYRLEGLSDQWFEKEYFNNIIEYQSLPPGNYCLHVVPIYKGKEGNEIRYSFVILPPFWETWWFYTLCGILLFTLVLLFYRWYYSRRIQKIKTESEINKLRLIAIQSQMNPHFIFNSINGIQQSVLKKDKKSTFRHINKFAKLVRLILNHSNSDRIALEEEIELLQLYLELEKKRFTDEFEFSIDVDADVHVPIPPMLIQPFVENAIIHGLFHKKGKKELKIQIKEDQLLTIIIEDNGIGREASLNKKQKSHEKSEKSFATSAIKRRMISLNQKYTTKEFKFEYVDLSDQNGEAIGTKVVITLPIIR